MSEVPRYLGAFLRRGRGLLLGAAEAAKKEASMNRGDKVLLWAAINKYTETCGGSTSYCGENVAREKAVAEVEEAVDAIIALPRLRHKHVWSEGDDQNPELSSWLCSVLVTVVGGPPAPCHKQAKFICLKCGSGRCASHMEEENGASSDDPWRAGRARRMEPKP